FHELWRGQVDALGLDRELTSALLDEARVDAALAGLPSAGARAHLHACTHTTFSPNVVTTVGPKTNVIPDVVDLDVDIRTVPGDRSDEVAAHLEAALGADLL